ncbi:MAG: crotonase [Spirochaetaceae bacterium]|nr:crotonase [Spirochaetaceae bacterium]|tara:strand:- start:240463 stop:241242 length:780 start_codon:yes stop_codon:yes gene_type:complete
MALTSLDKKNQYALLTINRPEALNALNEDILSEIHEHVESLNSDKDIRGLIITGTGEKAFCAGADIGQMASFNPEQAEAFARKGHKTMNAISGSDLITIAAINGFALGGGLELALSCDMRIASENARMGLPETGLGIIPGFGGTQRLSRLVGPALALEIILTGTQVKSDRALQIGLVNQVVELAELLPTAEKMMGIITGKKGPEAQKIARWLVHSGLEQPLSAALEREINEFSQIFSRKEPGIGLTAFKEKKEPNFTGE